MVEYWQNRYRKNFLCGIITSIIVHIVLLIIVLFFSLNSNGEEQKYFISTYTVQINKLPSNDTTWSGGGSMNDGVDELVKGSSTPQSISGIPVPSSEPDKIEFGNITNLEPPKDSLAGNGGGSGSGAGEGVGNGYGFGQGLGKGVKQLPYMPRQILEVVPQNTGGVKGTIILVLRIGTNGFPLEHKVIYNTVNDPDCMLDIIDAVYKSRWQ
jgi:hypothetical protein